VLEIQTEVVMSRRKEHCGQLALACLILFTACARQVDSGSDVSPPDAASQVNSLADAYVDAYFAAFPFQSLLSGAPDTWPELLADHSLAALERWQQREDGLLAELLEVDAAELRGTPEAMTYGFLKERLEAAVGFRACRMELWNVSPTWTGWQAEFTLLASMQPTQTQAQRSAALSRFSQISAYLDSEIANLREGVRLGYTAPQVNVRAVIEGVDSLLSVPVSDSPFVQIAGEGLPEFRSALEALVTNDVRPALARYRDYLHDDYLATARQAVGVNANPNGEVCYRAAIRYHTTLRLTPREIHDVGLAQMAAIRLEMREIGERSFGTADPDQLLEKVKADPQYRFKDRQHMIDAAEAAVERAHRELPNWFGRLAKAAVIVEPYPASQEKTAPGGLYLAPSKDGTKPGKYMINTYEADQQSIAGLEATAFHETYPGHHLQGSIALESDGLHPLLQYFYLSGYSEGWALYSERLAGEMGLYASDIDRLGLLSNEAFRAARLVVDTGMHAFGWTRQQAIDYVAQHTTSTDQQAAPEINRYIAAPGQANAYMLGSLEIRRLRERAEEALGASFDIRAFHDLMLESGSVPLWMLGEKTDDWIASRDGRAASGADR
jgi:uncharacterized protein (DUF885 family)